MVGCIISPPQPFRQNPLQTALDICGVSLDPVEEVRVQSQRSPHTSPVVCHIDKLSVDIKMIVDTCRGKQTSYSNSIASLNTHMHRKICIISAHLLPSVCVVDGCSSEGSGVGADDALGAVDCCLPAVFIVYRSVLEPEMV